MHMRRVGNGAPNLELAADASSRLLPTLALPLLAPSARALGLFMPAPKPSKEILDLTANTGVRTSQPPHSFDHEDRSKELDR